MAKNDHSGRKIALGALIAGAAGYITGVLTAPKSGKDTREDIAEKASDIKDDTTSQLLELQNELEGLIQKTKDKSVALSSQAREEFNESVVKAKDAKNKLSTAVKSVKTGEAEDPDLNKAIKQAKAAIKNLNKYFKG